MRCQSQPFESALVYQHIFMSGSKEKEKAIRLKTPGTREERDGERRQKDKELLTVSTVPFCLRKDRTRYALSFVEESF
jgi:hypothetical protein